MIFRKLIFTKSDCFRRNLEVADDRYRKFQKYGPEGLMMHTTGANNPYLWRYVGPDDGLLGRNRYGNDWNRPGVPACVHGFIGKLDDGRVAAYQTLYWNYRGWHCGRSGNDTHLSIEICEDGLDNRQYFEQTRDVAIEMAAMLCKQFGWDPLKPGVLIDHKEGHDMGIASNHGDTALWWSRFGYDMDDFRRDVKAYMAKEKEAEETEKEEEEMRYNTVSECPQWAQPTIQKLIDKDLLQGRAGTKNLDLTEDMLRILVIQDRAGLYD